MKKRRDYVPLLLAHHNATHSHRKPKDTPFQDETLSLLNMVMAQIDPDGERSLVYPPAYAEGAATQPSVRPSGKRSQHVD